MADMSKLRLARTVAGLTQQELADKIGVAVTTVAAWENGKASPTAPKIPRLAKALKKTPTAIIEMFSA